MRIALPASLALAALFASTADAHQGIRIELKAQYKESKQGDTTLRNVFLTGHCHYPDGTLLTCGFRPEAAGAPIQILRAIVHHQEFTAEMGPYTQVLPPGKYVGEVWFNFNLQSDDTKNALKSMDQFSKCIKDDPTYAEQYKQQDPEGYARLMKRIKDSGGICPSTEQYGHTEFTIGDPAEIAANTDAETAFVHDHMDLAKELLEELYRTAANHADPVRAANVNSELYFQWQKDWEERRDKAGAEIDDARRNMVVTTHQAVYDSMSNAFQNLFELEGIIRSGLYGDAAASKAKLDALSAKPELSRDDKRAIEQCSKSLAVVGGNREDLERRTVMSIIGSISGKEGLEPSEEAYARTLQELHDKLGMTWSFNK